jgi:2-hydroxychromene-2-carboxylate isomerase
VTRRPRLFFSFRSPFSRLLVERLLRELPEAHEEIDWVPFWEPDAATAAALAARGATVHYVPMSKAKHLYILQDTKRLAGQLGLRLAWPVDVAPWWEPSHLGWLAARRLGRAAEFYAAVVSARWERAEDVSDPEVIRRLADSVGLDGQALAGAVDDPEVRAEGVACLAQAYEEDVFGVPYLRLGWRRFWGFDRLDDFLAAYREVQADGAGAAPDPLAGVPIALRSPEMAYDADTAGGCG